MIKVQYGDALSVEDGILVHGCNCQGLMGSGIAKAIREKWKDVYDDYRHYHKYVGLDLGDVVFTHPSLGNPLYSGPKRPIVASALTQFDCGSDKSIQYVDYDAITASFSRIKIWAKKFNMPVHFPLIGCGLANGKWEEVGPRIEAALGPDIEKVLWLVPGTPNPYEVKKEEVNGKTE